MSHQSVEVLLSDAVFLFRLRRKVVHAVLKAKGPDIALSSSFLKVDQAHRSISALVSRENLFNIARPSFPANVITDIELKVLIEMARLTEESEVEQVSPVSFFLFVRQMLPYQGWQMYSSVQKARGKIFLSQNMSGFEEHVRDLVEGNPAPPIRPGEARGFLTKFCDLSGSEAEGVLLHCGLDEGTNTPLDVSLLQDLLFADPIEDSALYPLLCTVWAESVAVPGSPTGPSGSLALLEALRSARLCPPNSSWEKAAHTETTLDPSAWQNVCRSLHCPLSSEDTQKLFQYLGESQVPLGELLKVYRRHFPAIPLSTFEILQAATAKQIASQGGLVFVDLFNTLEEFGSGVIPLQDYLQAVKRFCGSDGNRGVVLYDLEVEYFWLKASNRVDLLLLLCGRRPAKREATIRKAFDCLSRDSPTSTVSARRAVEEFHTDDIEGKPLQSAAIAWKGALEKYVKSLETEELSYELFAFFWCMISAAIEDDPTFTLIMWKGYSLAERPLWK